MKGKTLPDSKVNQNKIKDAIKIGQALIKKNITKAEALMVAYRLLQECTPSAFIMD